MTTETSSDVLEVEPFAEELPPGYWIDPITGAWCSLPWPGDRALPWNHPDRLALLPPSLGPGVIRWGHEKLTHHLTGDAWRYTPGQIRFLWLWYAVTEEGRWIYRSGVKRGAKGTGKDPFGGAWALTEMCGPVSIADWDNGKPIGRRHNMSLVQIAANSEAQAADVLRVANAMLPLETKHEFGFDTGVTRTQLIDGSRIELLTASQASSEGDPATAILLNESHHMTASSGGHAVAATARRNVTKSPKYIGARLLELTNAHQQGSDAEAERSYIAWQNQVAGRLGDDPSKLRTRKLDILYDSIEAPPSTRIDDEESFMRGLAAAYSDSPWSDLERTRDEAWDSRTAIGDTVRYYLNGLGAAEDAWIDPPAMQGQKRELVVERGDRIAMFLDCSKSDDATFLVGCRLSDGFVFYLGAWQKPHGDRGKTWLAPRVEVDATVRQAIGEFTVEWFGVDPSPARDDEDESLYWMPTIDGWHRDFKDVIPNWATPGAGGHSVLFDMRMSARGGQERNKAFTEMAMQTVLDIEDEASVDRLIHDGHPMLVMHVINARRRPNRWGYSLGKVSRDSDLKIDGAVCMVGARLGRRFALNSGKSTKKRTGKVW